MSKTANYTICPKCKWKIEGKFDGVCGYCKVNKKLEIDPVIIPQHPKDKPVKNIEGEEIEFYVRTLHLSK